MSNRSIKDQSDFYTRLYYEILGSIETDEEPPIDIGRGLMAIWHDLTEPERDIMNNIFINLTGWTFKSLVNIADHGNPEDTRE